MTNPTPTKPKERVWKEGIYSGFMTPTKDKETSMKDRFDKKLGIYFEYNGETKKEILAFIKAETSKARKEGYEQGLKESK